MPMNKRKNLMLILTTVLAALAAAAGATASSKGTSLSLIAYSTPKPVLAKIIQAWQKTPDGSGVSFTQSYGPSTNAGEGGRRRPARRPRLPLDGRRRQPARRCRPRQLELEPPELRRDRGQHRRRLRGARRQPEAHQGLGRPREAGRSGRDTEPVQLRVGEVEHPRRLRCGAAPRQDRQAGDCVRAEALLARRVAGLVGLRTPPTPSSPARATC